MRSPVLRLRTSRRAFFDTRTSTGYDLINTPCRLTDLALKDPRMPPALSYASGRGNVSGAVWLSTSAMMPAPAGRAGAHAAWALTRGRVVSDRAATRQLLLRTPLSLLAVISVHKAGRAVIAWRPFGVRIGSGRLGPLFLDRLAGSAPDDRATWFG